MEAHERKMLDLVKSIEGCRREDLILDAVFVIVVAQAEDVGACAYEGVGGIVGLTALHFNENVHCIFNVSVSVFICKVSHLLIALCRLFVGENGIFIFGYKLISIGGKVGLNLTCKAVGKLDERTVVLTLDNGGGVLLGNVFGGVGLLFACVTAIAAGCLLAVGLGTLFGAVFGHASGGILDLIGTLGLGLRLIFTRGKCAYQHYCHKQNRKDLCLHIVLLFFKLVLQSYYIIIPYRSISVNTVGSQLI